MIRLPYPPSANVYYRNFRGRTVISTKGREFKVAAGWLCKAAGMQILGGPVAVLAILHPKLTKMNVARKTRIDIDNLCKPLLDCMNGIAYVDDSQIVRLVVEIGVAVKDGGISVLVTEAVQ